MSSLAVTGAAVWDGESDAPVDALVVVVDGRVEQVGGDLRDLTVGVDQVLDAAGSTVLPGLIDAHFHAYATSLALRAIEGRSLSYTAIAGARRLGAALSRGFTTVRDVAGGDAGLRQAIDEGLLPAPRYLYTGAALSQTGGHSDARGPNDEICGCHAHSGEVVDGVDELRRAVRRRFLDGAHAIKIMASGGVISQSDPLRVPQYSSEEIRAVTDEARRRGSYVAAHAYSPEAIRHAVEAGVRSIEHGNLLDASTAELMAATGAFLVPTLGTYEAMARRGPDLGMSSMSQDKNHQVLDAGRHSIELAHAAGVPVGFGTDLMGPLEEEQLACLRVQVEADGLLLALRSATSVNADLLGRPDLGRIRPGAVGDLLILDGDPFSDPSILWRESSRRTVVQAGRLV